MGVSNFIATTIIVKLIPLLRCQNVQVQSVLISTFVFWFCFTNAAIIPQLSTNLEVRIWLELYGGTIYTGMIMTSVLPYLMPIIGIIYKTVAKKEPPPLTRI